MIRIAQGLIKMSSILHGYIPRYGVNYLIKVLWCVGSGVLFWRTYVHYKYSLEFNYLQEIIGGTLCIARASAAVLNVNCAVVLLPVCHSLGLLLNTALRKLNIRCRWLRWNSNAYHIFFGNMILLFSAVHTAAHVWNLLRFSENNHGRDIGVHPYYNQTKVFYKMAFTTVNGLSGIVMVVVLVAIFITTLPPIRRRFYNVFWFSHRLFVIFYVLLLIHGLRGPLRRQLNVDRHYPGCVYTHVSNPDCDTSNGTNGASAALPCINTGVSEEAPNTTDIVAQASTIADTALNDVPIDRTSNATPTNNTGLGIQNADVLNNEAMPNATVPYICLDKPEFGRIEYETWIYLIFPLVIYLLDVLCRRLRTAYTVEVTRVTLVSDSTMELCFQLPDMRAKPGQYVLLQCSSVSTLEWHPFTIVQVPKKSNNYILKLLIARSGDWTERLFSTLSGAADRKQCSIDSFVNYPTFQIDGPYGSPMEKLGTYRHVLFIGGGVGITPFLAHIHYFLHKQKQLGTKQKSRHIHLIFAARDMGLINYVQDQTNTDTIEALRRIGIELDASFYFTGKQDALNSKQQNIYTVCDHKTRDHNGLSPTVGRPDLQEIFSKMRTRHKGSTTGTFVCGPSAMCGDVNNHCILYSSRKTNFTFYKESF